MKQLFIASILTLFLGLHSNGQEKKPATIKYYSKELLDELGATKDQQARIADLMKESKAKTEEIKKDEALSGDEKKAKIKEVISERAAAYYKVLTPEQNQKLTEMKKALAEKNAKQ